MIRADVAQNYKRPGLTIGPFCLFEGEGWALVVVVAQHILAHRVVDALIMTGSA